MGGDAQELVAAAQRGLRRVARVALVRQRCLALLLSASPVADVAQDDGEQLLVPHVDLRYGTLHREFLAAAAERHERHLRAHEAHADPCGGEVGDDAPIRLAEARWDQQLQGHADGAVGRDAEHPLGGGIEERDALLGVDADDRVHRRADDGRESRLGGSQLLGRAACSQVARDLGVPAQLTGRVANRGDDHIGPEAGAVLADTPTHVLVAPMDGRLAQDELRTTSTDVLGGEEDREVAPDHFVRGVALDALRAAVPGSDPAARVQQVDGVVADGVDQAPIDVLIGVIAGPRLVGERVRLRGRNASRVRLSPKEAVRFHGPKAWTLDHPALTQWPGQ